MSEDNPVQADPLAAAEPAKAADAPKVVFYWRPGCGFCMALRHKLDRAGLETIDRNIWDDPDAAAFVRDHANGNETVPTIDVAGTVMVNPSAQRVLAVAADAGIEVPPPPQRWWKR